MADKSLIPLPVAPEGYSVLDQSNMRSGLEGAILDIHVDIGGAKRMKNKESSLSIKRHQFLLMGSSGG
jgi:hypothetical protein